MMKYEWFEAYCLGKAGVTKDYSSDWDATRYFVGGKYFALTAQLKDRPIATLKNDPSNGDFLRQHYEDIVPGYYANKMHWSTVFLDGDVPDGVLKDMIDEAYTLVFEKLTKKVQKEIMETHESMKH